MIRISCYILGLLFLAFVPLSFATDSLTVGSKKFTESVILGEVIEGLAQATDTETKHFQELGGTKLLFDSLTNGDIDIYPEYTGTIAQEILRVPPETDLATLRKQLGEYGVRMSEPLGFNNTYALAMTKNRANELDIEKISDLVRHPDLAFGFSNEFANREDGWKNLQPFYGLPQTNARGLDHDLAYRQLNLGAIDVIDVYSTDAKIKFHDLQLLADDRAFFPRYDAVLLYRDDLAARYPAALESIQRLEGAIDESAIRDMNSRVELEGIPESRAAAEYLQSAMDVAVVVETETLTDRLLLRTFEHLNLVRRSLLPAILVGIPLGILAYRYTKFGYGVLSVVGVIQTIPSLALLVMLMPLMAALGLASVGLGSSTAVVALFLYSLLPIVRNTASGLSDVSQDHHETAIALGLPWKTRLMQIELPLASRSILAGISTAAILNIGFATLGALIGAGGYGQPILTGIRLNDSALILEGAIAAAVLALIVQATFTLAEHWLIPKGLRLQKRETNT
ncbi:MAG: amino acid ABC transporter permease [Planctomyces sp.]|nr:amino acid ABC transporter permease [Planctomyces sp.]